MKFKSFKLLLFQLTLFLFCFQLNAQVSILFQVDMSYQITLGKFNPNTEWVEVAGSFNGWNGSGRFADEDGDKIYELLIDGFQSGDNISYKFRLNGQWDGREEFPGVGNDRAFNVGNQRDTLFHWYNNEVPPNADLVADFVSTTREFYEQGVIQFNDLTAVELDSWEWTFEGGTPNSSTDNNPIVRYNNPGTYDVSLTVRQGDKSQTVTIEDYISVLERNTENIPWWNEAVFYEIFVRSFKDSDGNGRGDFQGLMEQLDYLNDGDPNTTDDLGITGIWLMPIHPAGSYHGYDVIDYKDVSQSLGGMDQFKAFLAAAHERGIRVIIDFVINHNSSQSEWFKNARTGPNAEYRNYYVWEENNPNYNGPWGQKVWHESNGDYYYGLFWDGMPDLNFKEPKVKEEIFSAAEFWLEDIGIDGFRLDAARYLFEEDGRLEDTQSTYDFWAELTAHNKAINPESFTVGEVWTGTDQILGYVKEDRIDYCFEFELAGNILSSINNGQTANLYAHMQKMYNLYPHLQYGTFLTNHDQNRLMNNVGNDESKVKLGAAIYLTLPGVPYIYYGEEIGMTGEKPDEFIRRPMQWDNTKNAGFSDGNPWIAVHGGFSKYNVERESSDPNSLLSTYRNLVQLRSREKALQLGAYEAVQTNNNQVFAYFRVHDQEPVLVIHNLGTSVIRDLELTIDYNDILVKGAWILEDLLIPENSTTTEVNNDKFNLSFTLSGRGTKIYKLTQVVDTKDLIATKSLKLYPNPVRNELLIESRVPNEGKRAYQIYDMQGKVIRSGFIDLSTGKVRLPMTGIPKGIYNLVMIGDKQLEQARFVKL